MKLFTKEIDKQLFAQYPKGSDLGSQKVVAKIFNPYGSGRWYLLNSDPEDPDYIWAIVEMNGNVEIGSVSRKQLESTRVTKWQFPLERDIYMSSRNAEEVYQGVLKGRTYKHGGDIGDENKEMLLNRAEGFEHHAEELEDAAKKADHVPAWVVAKAERASSDLSDITHYLDGENEQKREEKQGEEEYAKGGKLEVGRYYKTKDGKTFRYLGESTSEMGAFSDKEGGFHKISYEEIMADGGMTDFGDFYEWSSKEVKKNFGSEFAEGFPIVKFIQDLPQKTVESASGILKNGQKVFFDVDSMSWSIDSKMAKGGQVKMKHEKYHYQGMEVDGFKWQGFWDGYHHFVKREGSKYVETRATDQDIEDGNLKDMIKYGVSKEHGGMMADGGITEETEQIYFMIKPRLVSELTEKASKENVELEFIETNEDGNEVYRAELTNSQINDFTKLPLEYDFDYDYAKGGYMAKGGEIEVKVGDMVKSKKGVEGEVYESTGTFFKLKDKYGNKNPKFYSSRDFKPSDIKAMAKGGKIGFEGLSKKVAACYEGKKVPSKYQDLYGKTYDKAEAKEVGDKVAAKVYRLQQKMEGGGRVKFKDKVAAVKKSLLERKKVPKAVQKDYGKTFSPAEAEDSAKRIVGAQTYRERLQAIKKAKKKKK